MRKKHPRQHPHPALAAFDKALLKFRAPEYAYEEKSVIWFVIFGLLAAGLVLYGLMTDGWTFSLAIIVFAGTYYAWNRHKPGVVEVKISSVGLKIGAHIFSYSDIRGFWIIYNPPFVQKLYLRMASKFHPDIFVILNHANPAEVRRVLSSHILELPVKNEPFSDTLVRLLKL